VSEALREFGGVDILVNKRGALASLMVRVYERIKPGHPQQNGRHERMHLTRTSYDFRHILDTWAPLASSFHFLVS
jgi:hypothetical protein